MKVTLLYFDSCPSWRRTSAELTALAEEFGFSLEHEHINPDGYAKPMRLRGSPTVLIDEDDPFTTGDESVGLACRLYRTDEGMAGAPSPRQLRLAIEAALADPAQTAVTEVPPGRQPRRR